MYVIIRENPDEETRIKIEEKQKNNEKKLEEYYKKREQALKVQRDKNAKKEEERLK